MVFFSGIKARYPEVGLGVVGIKTLSIFSEASSPPSAIGVSAVTKPIE
ncbi:unnamed protein product [marine sediment metagenome]|uniref:Uncharacterized protein n=1 Tax=marine sediment metagenome TaxID=412755 RepID=X1LBA2_9ZZZZ